MNTNHTCPRCNGVRIYRKCVHGCDGKTPEDVRRERNQKRKSLGKVPVTTRVG